MKRFFIILICLLTVVASSAQTKSCRFMFYNVENLFDTINNPDTRDEEFLPEGNRHWGSWKYQTKLNHIYKVIMAVKEWETLPFIGLCEVENKTVLNHLLYKTPLFQNGYKIIHQDSPDERGIDVAMLYQPGEFTLINYQYFPLKFQEDPTDRTRDLLYVKGTVFGGDTLHFFINHWPSRYGGYSLTAPKRLAAARFLTKKVDSITKTNAHAAIIIAGDFNDEPSDESITALLEEAESDRLISLPLSGNTGTTKYRSQWYLFDQVIVSKSLTHEKNGLSVKEMQIGMFPFLLHDDERYGGEKPYRTYLGPRYQGGFSDHLPVFIDIVKQKQSSP